MQVKNIAEYNGTPVQNNDLFHALSIFAHSGCRKINGAQKLMGLMYHL